ncbi:MAG: InlB B-repeat-containing protein [Anaeroplasmataceae bacterium]|nr:InlB B-repeat-containing protein [Anaeroplasmataceae bacterium]
MKKKLFFGFLCVLAVFGLASCKNDKKEPDDKPPVTEVTKYTVTFNVNGGSSVSAQSVETGKLVTKPADPTREGYIFAGWYKDSECKNIWDFTKDVVTENVTLYAKWEAEEKPTESYTITFEMKGHGTAPSNIEKATALPTPLPSVADVEGWHFVGWYKDSECNTAAVAGEVLTANITLYAKWEPSDVPVVPETYTITFEMKGHGTAPSNIEKATALPTPLPSVTDVEGWRFEGWYKDSECNTAAVAGEALTENVILYAKWTQLFNVTYNVGGHGTAENLTGVTALPAELPVLNAVGYRFDGWYMDSNFTIPAEVGKVLTENVTLYAKWSQYFSLTYQLNGHSTSIEGFDSITHLPDTLPTPTANGCKFEGWYLDKALQTKAVAGEQLTKNTTLYASWSILPGFEEVSYVILGDDLTAGKSPTPILVNKFTIGANTEVRNRNKSWTNPETGATISFTKSIKLGASSDKLEIDVPGEGKLYIWVQNGSGSADYQTITLNKPNGTSENIKYVGTVASSPIVRLEIDVVEGKYSITRPSGTSDIFKAELNCVLEQSEETGFEIVSDGKVDYISGQAYDGSGIQLNRTFGNGRTESLSLTDPNIVIDSSSFGTAAGEYTISVQYKDYASQTFTVTVYELESIRLGFNATEKLANTKAGNGVYFNQTVKRVYPLNASLDCSYLSVTAITAYNGKTKEFMLSEGEYSIDADAFNASNSVAGKKTITVTAKGSTISQEFEVYVVDTVPSMVNDVIQIHVDATYTGELGAVVAGYNSFTTIQQALDYLKNLGKTYDSKKKLIVLSAGTYREKLEFTLPNVELRGAGRDTTIIEWNSLYGVPDESGYVQTTDSCSTFNVRETATNMIITGVTLSNYWNSLAVFDRDLGVGYAEHRALALLVQADQFIMRDCKLLGYQDTLELFTGRQFIENTYISGTTDFIFGTNNTTYFKNCQIHSITNGKTDGGYITAFKGCNKGASDYVTYGAIFDGCAFTADADVVANKNTAIGRCWGAYAAVMVMNSTLDAHISTKPFSNSTKNERYVSMNANPDASTVKFFEYNNEGPGSISASIRGVTVLTDATVANKYADYSVIFGTENGLVRYTLPWNPASTTPVEDTNIYYNFSPATESATGTNYTIETSLSLSGATAVFGNMTLDATVGRIAFNANANCVNLKTGASIVFNVEANTTVIVNTFTNYHYYTINGVATVSDTFVKYFAEAQQVTIVSTGDLYLQQITLSQDRPEPEAPVLTELKLDKPKTEFVIGDSFEVGNLVVSATYSDNSVVVLEEGEYTINHNIDINTAGSYEVTIIVDTLRKSYTVVYEAADADPAISSATTLDFTVDGGYENGRVNYDSAEIARNGDNSKFLGTISFDVKEGAIIYVVPYKTYGYFTIGMEGETDLTICTTPEKYVAPRDCTIVITGLTNSETGNPNYISQIGISYPISEAKTYTFRSDGDFDHKVTGVFNGVAGYSDVFYIDARTGKFEPRASQWAIFNNTTKMEFTVAAGAKVTFNFYTADFTIDGTAISANTVTKTYEEQTTIEIVATGNSYIDSIIIEFE